MKILQILGSDRFAGAENVVCQIAEMFRDDSSLEIVYCSRDGDIRETLAERNIRFAPISSLSTGELRRVIREQKPDILHAHDMGATFCAAQSCGKIPLISHIHGNAVSSRRINLRTLAYLWASRRAQRILWVSESSRDGYVFKSRLKNKSLVLNNVISRTQIYDRVEWDKNEYGYDVVFVGRLCNEKNPLRFLDVVSGIKQRRPNLRVAMLGDGYLHDAVAEKTARLGLSENISMLGFVDNPLKIMKSASVMVVTSVSEGLPMCALEAMCLGVPIVSTPTDGLCDIIVNGYNGYLSDSDEELADFAAEIVADTKKRDILSLNTLEHFEKINNYVGYKETLKKIYEELTAN